MSGSAKATSRASINAVHRQVNNKQSNRHGSQIVISSSQGAKTPLAAQLSTGVTTGSQKHLQLAMKEGNPMAAASKTHTGMGKSTAALKPANSGSFHGTPGQSGNGSFGIKRPSINSSGITQVPQNSAATNKMRKAPSDFQLASFLVVQNNLSHTIGHNDGNYSLSQSKPSRQKPQSMTTGISPIKSSRRVGTATTIQQTIQQVSQMNAKHSRSSAHMDVAKMSLTHRGENESPAIVKAQLKAHPAQLVSKQPSVESSTYIP